MAMTTVNIHDAKTQLSRLIERVEHGEEVVIARQQPVVKLTQFKPAGKPKKRKLGGLEGYGFKVTDIFDTMGQSEIEAMFYCRDAK